jgi:hypothetical protein
LKNFFENYRGSRKFISHRVAAAARLDFFISRRVAVVFFYKPSRRGSGAVAFFLTSRRGSSSFSAAMDISASLTRFAFCFTNYQE